MIHQQITPSPIHVSVHQAVDHTRRAVVRCASRDRTDDQLAPTSTLTEKLTAHADGRSVDADTRRYLDGMIVDYIDGLLEPKAARDLERSMRQSPVVARLVADKAKEIDLRNRLSLYCDGELNPTRTTEIERLIARDPSVAGMAADIRRGGDLLRVALQPIPGQDSDHPDVETLRRAFESPSDEADPIVRFSALIPYAAGTLVDEKTRDLLERLITDYLDGGLDRRAMQGLEAAMRLSPSLARLVANWTDEAGA